MLSLVIKCQIIASFLTDAEIWNLVKFLKNEVIDVTQLYDATYTSEPIQLEKRHLQILGKMEMQQMAKHITTTMHTRHGADGKLIPNLDGTTGMTLVNSYAQNLMKHNIKKNLVSLVHQ